MKQIPVLAALLILFSQCQNQENNKSEKLPESARSMEFFSMARMYPDGKMHSDLYAQAMAETRELAANRGPLTEWDAIGPKNIGGRTLCLAIHPLDSNILFLGAASGGLWKTTVGGRGVDAWQRIETGFPVLGVGAVAINPNNPLEMYIGTGEVYNYENSMPNVAFRTTRGTYGIGILKTTDGGNTWTKSLDWAYTDLTGVQEIRINPLRPETVWASTTRGLMRTYNSGANWELIIDRPMAVDLEISPDTNTVFVTFGSLDDNAISGLWRSANGGVSFNPITNGLPAAGYSGKALLSIAPSDPNLLYLSIGDAFEQVGLFRSTDNGENWQNINGTDVCTYQGWYSHDIAIRPDNPDDLIWVGIDLWRSVSAGQNFSKATYWYLWNFGQVPEGGPEGPSDYVHADIHHVYYHPTDPNKVYCVTDGGLFVSSNGGQKWEGRNGGYQSQQFFANFSNSTTDPNIGLGGMQDNSTAVFTGSRSWTRGIGGDGCCTAIHPEADNIMFGSAQYAYLAASYDYGSNWGGFPAPTPGNNAAFVAPFELAPTNPDYMYLGEDILSRFDFSTGEWTVLTETGNSILTIAVSNNNPDDVFYATVPGNTPPAIHRIDASTLESSTMTGLPDRMCMDIARHPGDDETVYVVFSGFGSGHVWKTNDGGTSWTNIDNGLPNVPCNSILVDPLSPNHLYVGNDLGVWFSDNDGSSWEYFSAGGPQAMIAMHLSISADRKLRVATHGLGVWQAPLVFEPVGTKQIAGAIPEMSIFPNPAKDYFQVKLQGKKEINGNIRLVRANGQLIWQQAGVRLSPGVPFQVPLTGCAAGQYYVVVESGKERAVKVLQVVR